MHLLQRHASEHSRRRTAPAGLPPLSTLDQVFPSVHTLLQTVRSNLARIAPDQTAKGIPNCFGEDITAVEEVSGSTPHPLLLLVFSLAAVDSPEAGIVVLSRWISQAKARPENIGLRWYIVRAEFELAQLATKFVRPLMEIERLVVFERQLTDEYAVLLNAGSAGRWDSLCRQLRVRGLHAALGRRLAFTYAALRNYLFEIQTPGTLDNWRQVKRTDLLDHLRADLSEATAIAAAEQCFAGVPDFEQHRSQWIGQFELNAAQLRIGLLPELPDSEASAARVEIARLLAAAKAHLGQAPIPASDAISPVDLLLGSDPFEDQRARVRLLQSLLAPISPPG